MGSPSLFTRQWVLKMGYFYWLHIKNSVEAIPQQAGVSSPFRDSRFFHRDYVRP